MSAFRKKFLLGSASALAGFIGYGRQAYAACTVTTSPSYLCSGVNTTTQTINATSATVSTAAGFSVDTTLSGGDAISIQGDGNLSFTDTNNSAITGKLNGLSIRGTGDNTIAVDVNGAVTGYTYSGIGIAGYGNYSTGTIAVTTEAGSNVYGYAQGISVNNLGLGKVVVTANGYVGGYQHAGIDVDNSKGSKTHRASKSRRGPTPASLELNTGSGPGIMAPEQSISPSMVMSPSLMVARAPTLASMLTRATPATSM